MNGLKVGDKVYTPERWSGDGVNGVREYDVVNATSKQIKARVIDKHSNYVYTFRLIDLGNKVFLTPESAL